MSNRSTHLLRVRWAAVGAAVAVALGGGVLQITHATSNSGVRSVFVPITPCRLVDTRVAPDQVGSRSTPLGPGEIFTQQVTGTNGNCTIPTDAVAVSLNVTVVGGTANSFLTIYPADATKPLAANLNWVAGAPPTPNKVDVKLAGRGAVAVFNQQGTVNLIADVAGYYVDHQHDDRYYTKAEIDTKLGPTTHSITMTGFGMVDVSGNQIALAKGGGCTVIPTLRSGAIDLTLPVGAVITSVSVQVWDTVTTTNIGVGLYRASQGSSGLTSNFPYSTGSSGASTLEVTPSPNLPPAGPAISYFLQTSSTTYTAGTLMFCGAAVTYTL
jgi:hypothetical protein